ncbi:MAG: hypothetical protein V4858_03055 [Pseudomonadota bacterium]
MNKLISRLTDVIAYGILMNLRDLSNDVIVSMLERIGSSFLHGAGEDADLRIEVSRLISWQKFAILSTRDAPFAEVDRLYQEVLSLGFSSLMDEGTAGIYFAQYCIRLQKFELAMVVLETMLHKATDVSLGPPGVRKQLARDAKRIRDELHLRDG